ncbi:MAG: hypothetical protein EOM24_24500 [Chloroflexia bacterium]|nr:hypothetical protein [Chloroflexia bacterium]
MPTYSVPQCLNCRHFIGGIGPLDEEDEPTGPLGCAAFPAEPGIPVAILHSKHDHRHPYPGDNGIRYEPCTPLG